MTILITGGTGNTGLCLAKRLREANHSVLLTSHSRPVPEPFEGVRFDWLDTSTHENPFNAAHDIDSLYIICPQVYDMLGATRPFLDLAVAKGVKRFVLMSGTAMVKGSEAMGKVHEYIVALGVDYCILRPTGFIGKRYNSTTRVPLAILLIMQAELFGTHFLRGIRDENYIASAAKDGRIPLIGVDDIVDVAFDALVDEESHNTEHIIVGPELFSYDEVCFRVLFFRSETAGNTLGRLQLCSVKSSEEG
ncbi:hypothetical protein H0H87_012060 [Tephrocybe sp. NHM501043]|nr:hypothetical protein H0H87_012060 [Tephrocybe sp. NHM501043]